jgi:hypothetical protein
VYLDDLMKVLEAPDIDPTKKIFVNHRQMRGIADGVVGCSRCICFNDSNITGANWRLFVVLTLGAQENVARECKRGTWCGTSTNYVLAYEKLICSTRSSI